MLLTYRGVVQPWHCDLMGHMNVMWYTGKFDEATWGLFATVGIHSEYIREQKRGMVAVQQNTAYKKELLAGEVVSVRSCFLEVREKVLLLQHEMINDQTGEVAATTELTGVHLDMVSRKSCPFPAEIAARIQASLETKSGQQNES
jgi:acyl-CoA thioester hydrolase